MTAAEFTALMVRRAMRIASQHAQHKDDYSQTLARAWRIEAARLARA